MGFRGPFYIVSPLILWGRVFTERYCHNSQILFLEAWLEVLGYGNVTADDIEAWRREHMSILLTRLIPLTYGIPLTFRRSVIANNDYQPNFRILDIPSVDKLVTDSSRTYTGTATCESTYRVQRPAVPYGNQTEASALHFEDGFKLLVTWLKVGIWHPRRMDKLLPMMGALLLFPSLVVLRLIIQSTNGGSFPITITRRVKLIILVVPIMGAILGSTLR